MKEYVPVAKSCEHCSRKRGSFGCCSTVSNNWVYSCAEGQKEWVLDKIRAEIEQNAYPIVHGVNNHELGMTLHGILQVIDKYRAESEG